MNGAQRMVWAGAGIFLATSMAMSAGWFDHPDVVVDQWVLHHITPETRATVGGALSTPGVGAVASAVAAIAGLLAWRAGATATALILVAAMLLGGVLVDTFKAAYHRPYPMHELRSVGPQLNATGDRLTESQIENGTWAEDRVIFAFDASNASNVPATFPTRPGRAYPSGHTMGGMGWAIAILLGVRAVQHRAGFDRWAIRAAIAVAFLVGVGRVVVRAHWISDVIGSWGLGLAILGLAILADDAWRARRSRLPAAGDL